MDNTIMVVDDEVVILKTMEQILGRSGYSARCASCGKDALEIVEKEDIHVYFLDLKMPDMNGIELCRKIREKKPLACIYAITGYVSDYHIEWCRKAGFDDYFVKPFTVDTILNTAKAAFEKLRRWKKQESEFFGDVQ